MIRIVLADDDQSVLNGMTIFLRAFDDLDIVGTALDGEEAVELVNRLLPDVVMLDVTMPNMDGIEAARHIHDAHPQIRIIALTSHEDSKTRNAMLDAGAVEYLEKTIGVVKMTNAIRKVMGITLDSSSPTTSVAQ